MGIPPPNGNIALSVIVRVVGGPTFLKRCLHSLVPQIQGRPIEVLVPWDRTIVSIRELSVEFPQVTFVEMTLPETEDWDKPEHAHHLYDLRTTAGLHAARGGIIAHTEDFAIPASDWCERVVQAHELPHGVIGGAVEHSGLGTLNWAIYWLDFGRYHLPFDEGRAEYLSDVNVSYKRSALDAIKTIWTERYNEASAHWAFVDLGGVLWLLPEIVVSEDRGQLFLLNALKERYAWGRVFGSMRVREVTFLRRILYIVSIPLIPIVMMSRIAHRVLFGRRDRLQLVYAWPMMTILAVGWCFGELVGYISGRESGSLLVRTGARNSDRAELVS